METNKRRKRTAKRGDRGNVTTERSLSHAGQEISSSSKSGESIEEVVAKEAAFVTVTGGMTRNLGDFNSAKIGVTVTMPCEPTEEAVRENYERCSRLVDSFMDEEYESAVKELEDHEG